MHYYHCYVCLLLCVVVDINLQTIGCEAFQTYSSLQNALPQKQRRQHYTITSTTLAIRKSDGDDQDDTTASDQSSKSTEDNDDDNSPNKEKNRFTLYEISQIEERANRKNMNRLMLLPRIGQALTGLAYAFVISSIALQIFGYGYVRGPNGFLDITTLENRAFQLELMKSSSNPDN
mmetsp:Transcript_24309/g.36032  ORF Transcript_24309/g.36032 Transcript_24309/m.36032 type:complete len:176 (-) Transcript_24309:237-764(-)|eukprot:CAMPEP_0194224574 /NCGR_PEP_ID=MMETSP0156-20130528/37806_1 /TAXON_ID=33649 /ORGANISM="Thalassionema nitzschioides, Strain L26-B" /LENGTH=175 /DNA_ID=CAMNT_0038956205 /DNA_START=81 /DNA_END=608 /DNA_ORIENTATION=+